MPQAIPYLIVASAAVSAVAAVRQGQAAQAASKFNAEVANQNAQAARQQAAQNAAQVDRENYLRLGVIRANQGHSGGTESGSVLDVIGDAAAQGELQKQNVLYGGEMQARGYGNTSSLDTTSGANAQSGSYLKAGSELLSGGADAYAMNAKLNRK